MSKTAQRKRSYRQLGEIDFNQFGTYFMPFAKYKHTLNKAYKKGFDEARINAELIENKSILNWFRTKFYM